jgi:hypothetical protein
VVGNRVPTVKKVWLFKNCADGKVTSVSVTPLSYLGNTHLLVLMFRLYLYYWTYLGLSRYLDP